MLVLAVGLFSSANKVAVGFTFFSLTLIWDSKWLVIKGFLTNIYIFVVAEILVLIWGLVVAIARLIPGEAGRPIRMISIAYTDIFRGLPAIISIYLVGCVVDQFQPFGIVHFCREGFYDEVDLIYVLQAFIKNTRIHFFHVHNFICRKMIILPNERPCSVVFIHQPQLPLCNIPDALVVGYNGFDLRQLIVIFTVLLFLLFCPVGNLIQFQFGSCVL